MMAYSTTAPSSITAPGMTMESRTIAPCCTVTPANSTEKSMTPATSQPSVIIEFCTVAPDGQSGGHHRVAGVDFPIGIAQHEGHVGVQ